MCRDLHTLSMSPKKATSQATAPSPRHTSAQDSPPLPRGIRVAARGPARLAGMVHGVVVQTANSKSLKLSKASGSSVHLKTA